MGLLVFLSRRHSIISTQNRIELRLTDLNKKLQDLQQYASNIADGSMSMKDMMNVPGSLFGRQMMFMQYSHGAAMMGANQQMTGMQPMIQQQMMQMQDPNAQMMYQNWVFQNLYKQQREQISKQEEKLLNQQEQEITQEKTKLEMQLKMIQQEYEGLKQAEDKAVERLRPNYVG